MQRFSLSFIDSQFTAVAGPLSLGKIWRQMVVFIMIKSRKVVIAVVVSATAPIFTSPIAYSTYDNFEV